MCNSVNSQVEVTKKQKAKENRKIVTPYAFEVSPELFGTPLASPIRRVSALLIDLLFVALLSDVSSVFLTALAAVTFLIARHKLKKGQKSKPLRIMFASLAVLMILLFTLSVIETLVGSTNSNETRVSVDNDTSPNDSLEIDTAEALGLTAKYAVKTFKTFEEIDNGECSNANICWQTVADELAVDLAQRDISPRNARDLLEKLTDQAQQSLSEQELEKLYGASWQTFIATREAQNKPGETSVPIVDDTMPQTEPNQLIDADKQNNSASSYSLIELVKGIVNDLGLGFGWAAFYFTALTTWLGGQTPGKKLLGIRVIKLDGSRLSLWESFERYGGYGAGLATGLLGFLQVFWDANRQAIQDKLSETLVIDLRKNKIILRESTDVQTPKPSDSPT
jgi:uncharacterized RDD family membrane protein YckC